MSAPDPKPDQKLNNTLVSRLDLNSPRARGNAMGMTALVASIRNQETQIREGGVQKPSRRSTLKNA